MKQGPREDQRVGPLVHLLEVTHREISMASLLEISNAFLAQTKLAELILLAIVESSLPMVGRDQPSFLEFDLLTYLGAFSGGDHDDDYDDVHVLLYGFALFSFFNLKL